MRNQFDPFERGLRAESEVSQATRRIRHAIYPGFWNSRAPGGSYKCVQCPLRLLLAPAADPVHMSLQCGGFLHTCSGVTGGEQPGKLLFTDRSREPAKQQMRSIWQRSQTQRDSKRELE